MFIVSSRRELMRIRIPGTCLPLSHGLLRKKNARDPLTDKHEAFASLLPPTWIRSQKACFSSLMFFVSCSCPNHLGQKFVSVGEMIFCNPPGIVAINNTISRKQHGGQFPKSPSSKYVPDLGSVMYRWKFGLTKGTR